MIESPWLKEVLEECEVKLQRKNILEILEVRFGAIEPEVSADLQRITDPVRLRELLLLAARCPHLDAFRARL